MPKKEDRRTCYGASKYAALHLLWARWLRNYAQPMSYHYVTLAGTELKDCQSLNFIDPKLAASIVSFEQEAARHEFAVSSAAKLNSSGVVVNIKKGDIFDFTREYEEPHLFFFDFEGICCLGDLHLRFGELFLDGRLREDDTVFVTSYLGRNLGWDKMLSMFDSEFRVLGVTDVGMKKRLYRRAHPSFTLYRGLSHAGMQGDLSLKSIGCIEYHDTSAMGVYGFALQKGFTDFSEFIGTIPYFHAKDGLFLPAEAA